MSEQPMPTPGQGDVTEALITELRQRQAKGIETYGTSLQTYNGRSALRDALEEALDLAQYLKQALMEQESLPPLPDRVVLIDAAIRARDIVPQNDPRLSETTGKVVDAVLAAANYTALRQAATHHEQRHQDYRQRWEMASALFHKERQRTDKLAQALGDLLVRLDHVGPEVKAARALLNEVPQ